MAQSRSKKEILKESLDGNLIRYPKGNKENCILKAMDNHAKQEAIAFANWLSYQKPSKKNTEELYYEFIIATS